MARADHDRAVVVDLGALQSPTTRRRGIGRYALGWCRALERAAPGLIGRYLLDPLLPPLPGEAFDLVSSGKVRYRDADDALPAGARLVHTFSLLDPAVGLGQCWPEWPGRPRPLRSVTVFDCIPALDPKTHLADPADRARYFARFALAGSADRLQVLAGAVAADLRRLAGVRPARIDVVGAAADDRFVPAADREQARRRSGAAVEGLRGRYVLYPSGSHPRKNNETLVRAWCRLPAGLLRRFQLVITGDLPAAMRVHYVLLARRLGLGSGVVIPGDVDEDTYLSLLQGADLVCFPSLLEGFGLPVVEALACATPVIASDRPPLDELVPRSRRFDPDAPGSVAVAIVRALADGATTERPPALPVWDEVAARAIASLEQLLGRPGASSGALGRRSRRDTRRRVAIVTPLPPAQTGVAAYSFRLIEELRASGAVALELFADGRVPDQHGPDGLPVRLASTLHAIESLAGPYDHVVYTIGNSHFHLGALQALRRRAGVVVCHDVRLTNLYLAEHGDVPIEARSLPRAVQQIYGPDMPQELGEGNVFSDEQVRRFGLLLAREVIESSVAYLVSSRAARDLALSEVAGRFAARIGVLPFAVEAPLVQTDGVGEGGAGGERGAGGGERGAPGGELGEASLVALGEAPLVAHFGIVDPAKEPVRLLEAFALLVRAMPHARLAFVGPVATTLAAELHRRAAALGVAQAVLFTGPVPTRVFRSFMQRATVAVQMRAGFNGEASAAVGQCLASGVPTVVSRLGWMGELPGDAVVQVPPRVEPELLAGVLTELLADAPRRAALAAAAAELAARQGFAQTATALLEVLDGLPGAVARAG